MGHVTRCAGHKYYKEANRPAGCSEGNSIWCFYCVVIKTKLNSRATSGPKNMDSSKKIIKNAQQEKNIKNRPLVSKTLKEFVRNF